MGLRLLVLGVICLCLMSLDRRSQHLDTPRDVLSTAMHPLKMVVDAPRHAALALQQKLKNRQALQTEVSMLGEQQILLEAQLQKMAALKAENSRMRDLLHSAEKVDNQVSIADLMDVGLGPNQHQIMLNQGSKNGSYIGQPLLDAHGVIGQITEVSQLSSKATLITDAGHAIPIEINRSGQRTIARGTGENNRITLPFLPKNSDIREGDLLVTSGIGGSFPAGYPVAKVVAVKIDPSSVFATVEAEPIGQLQSSRRVLLVAASNASSTRVASQEGLQKAQKLAAMVAKLEAQAADAQGVSQSRDRYSAPPRSNLYRVPVTADNL